MEKLIVDIVAPASLNGGETLLEAILKLENWKFKTRNHINFKNKHPFHSDEDDLRLKDLIKAISAKDSEIIWCLRGGYGSVRLLEKLSKIKKPSAKKLLIGFSDITALHIFFNQHWGIKTLHGPTVSSFINEKLDKKSLLELKKMIESNNFSNEFKITPLNSCAKLNNSIIKGKILGGNLAIVQSLIGTKFQLKGNARILIFEDINEAGYKIDRMLQHLLMANTFKGCKAIIFGDFTFAQESQIPHILFALKRFANLINIPVYKTNQFGHGKINRPILLNSISKIENKRLIVDCGN